MESITILTYMVDGSYMGAYLRLHNMEYDKASVVGSYGNGFELKPYSVDVEQRSRWRKLITLYNDDSPIDYGPLSVTWYRGNVEKRSKSSEATKLRRGLRRFLETSMKADPCDVMWTCPKDSRSAIAPKGYKLIRKLTNEEQSRSPKELEEYIDDSMDHWLKIFKFPSVERGTYDRLECTAKHQIYPLIGEKVVGDITPADIKTLLNHWMNKGYAYTTVKKVHNLLTDYFRYLNQQELIPKNPMLAAPMIKKANFMASQGKESRPTFETVTTFSAEEIEKFKLEAFRTWGNGERIYQQVAAYILMLNTGLRTGEVLGLLNSDIDLQRRVVHLLRGVKEVARRDGLEATSGREVKVGKLKTASSKRNVPLNQAAVDSILDLRAERYFGEDSPLIPDEQGNYTRPVNFRKRYYRILEAAGLDRKGLHSLRHTFATTLVNGVKQPDDSIKALSPRQVADLLGHSTSEITELYYVKKDTARLAGITAGFEL